MSSTGRFRNRPLYSDDEEEKEENENPNKTPEFVLLLQHVDSLSDQISSLQSIQEQCNKKLDDLFVQLGLKNSMEERKRELQDLINKHFYKLFSAAKFVDALAPKSSTSQQALLLEFRKVIPEITEAIVAEMATQRWVLTFVQDTFSRMRSEFIFGISRAIGAIYGIKFLKKKRVTLWTESWTDEFISRDQLKETLRKIVLRDLSTNILNRMFEDTKVRSRFWPDINPTCSDLVFVFLKMRWFIEGHTRQIGEDDMVETLTKWKAAATDNFDPKHPLATSPSSSSSYSSSPSPSSSSLRRSSVVLRPSPSLLPSSASPSPSSSISPVQLDACEDRLQELSAEWHRLSKAPFSLLAYENLKGDLLELRQQVHSQPATDKSKLVLMDVKARIELVEERIKTEKKDVFPSAIGGPKPSKRAAIRDNDDEGDPDGKEAPLTKKAKATKNAKPVPSQPKGRGKRTK